MELLKRAVVVISGIVQGVGFRPFIYRVAKKYNLKGYIRNDGKGVRVEVEGEEKDILEFIRSVEAQKPTMSQITSLEVDFKDSLVGYTDFLIEESIKDDRKEVSISPDISICDRCIEEMLDPFNRRYLYPFINCTNCGPRFSIIHALPYDRENTVMKKFTMCLECNREYKDPTDRRFHAQPNACHVCGPQLFLYTSTGRLVSEKMKALEEACKIIQEGMVVAVKGIGGFHLVCDATNTEAVSLLRQRKRRLEKPFAVMFKDIQQVREYTRITPHEESLLTSPQRPIVLVQRLQDEKLSPLVAPDLDRVGVFLPYSPLHQLILTKVNRPLVVTSANISGEPMIKDNQEALEKLPQSADFILLHNRDIKNRVDDSVVLSVGEKRVFLRVGRGYAPLSFKLPGKLRKNVLAVGGHQKVSVAIAFEDNVIISPYIGDMETVESVEAFQETVFTLFKLYDFWPEVVVSDLHPGYYTTKWAQLFSEENQLEHLKVQHHIAHALSLNLDADVKEEILYVCWDGTGYGFDGNLWGGEFLISDGSNIARAMSFRYFRLIGGEKAIREPRRVALSILFQLCGKDMLRLNIPAVLSFKEREIENLYTLWEKGINSPLTSSVGRLFDAVSSILGIKHTVSYEGQSGMIIERFYDPSVREFYPFKVENDQIDWSSMFFGIIDDRDKKSLAVSKFINTLSKIAVEVSKIYQLNIGLSGGVFQNGKLIGRILEDCKRERIKVYLHSSLPPNDGGLALGQLGFILKMVK